MVDKITEEDIWTRLAGVKRGQDAIYRSVRFLWDAMRFFHLSDERCADVLKSDLRMGFLVARIAQHDLRFSPELVRDWQEAFDITREDVRHIFVKNVHGLALPVSMVADHVQTVADYFQVCGYGRSAFIKAFLAYPTLFGQPAETIIGHIESVSRHFAPDGLTQKMYVGMALNNPSLFFLDGQRTIDRVEAILSWFHKGGIKRSVGMQRIMHNPSLFYVKTETVIGHVEQATSVLQAYGVSSEVYRKAVGNQPALFFTDAEMMRKRIETVVNHFREEGLTEKGYAAIAVALPRLLLGDPNRMIHHIESVQRHFAQDGMTMRDYVRAAIKQKTLFSQNPQTIIRHIETVLSVVQAAGGSRQDYVAAALKQPSLFSLDTETVLRHARFVIQTGLRLGIWNEEKTTWAWLCRRPVVLCLSDENLRRRELLGKMQKNAGQVVFKNIFSISRFDVLQQMCLLNGIVLGELYADIDARQLKRAAASKVIRHQRDEVAFRYMRRQYTANQKDPRV